MKKAKLKRAERMVWPSSVRGDKWVLETSHKGLIIIEYAIYNTSFIIPTRSSSYCSFFSIYMYLL